MDKLHRDTKPTESKQYRDSKVFVEAKRDVVDYKSGVVWLKAKEKAAIKEAHFSAERFTIMKKDGSEYEVSWFRLKDDFNILNLKRVIARAVATVVFWPKIKAHYKIEISCHYKRLIVFDDKKTYLHYCDTSKSGQKNYCYLEDAIVFTRSEGRWRIGGGAYCSIPTIAESLFEFQYPVTAEQVDYMESFVEMIADVLDMAEKDGWITKEEQDYERNLSQRFIVDRDNDKFADVNEDVEYKSIFLDESLGESKTYLYLMKHANGLTKIGVSRQPKIREKTLQAEDPRLELHYAVPASRSIEKRLHDIFSEHRVRGEWFRLRDNHVQWIKLLCGRDVSMAMQNKETCDSL